MGALFALALSAIWYVATTRSGLAQLRDDLKARGFKLSLSELKTSDHGGSTNLVQFAELDEELQQVTALEAGSRVRLMRISPGPLPAIRRNGPFRDPSDNPNLTILTWEDFVEIMRRAEPTCERLRRLARQQSSENETWSDVSVFNFINDASWLANDAVSALREGSRERALEDLESLTDLALVRAREKQHIAQIGTAAVIHIGLMTSWEVLQSADWDEAEFKRMEVAWQRIWPIQGAQRAAECEVAAAGEIWSEVNKEAAKAQGQDRWSIAIGRLDMASDAQFLLQFPLAHFDAASALERGADWKALRPGLQKLKADAYTRTHSRYRHFGLRLLLSKSDFTFEDCAQNEAAKQLLLTDIAIRKFELRHRALPKALRELRPQFLDPTCGRDVFGAGDLKYKVNPEGTYLLYSVGLDGVDDGGAVPPSAGSHGFWESADMVWPRCR